MYLLLILGCLLLILITVFLYFFFIAFVRKNIVNSQTIDYNLEDSLKKYKNVIDKGYEFINNKPHRRVFTTSFDGLKLSARYYNQNSDKTILLFHGYRSNAAHDFSCAVEMYYNKGFNILLVDQRSHSKSEGKLITFGVKEQHDVSSWLQYLISSFGEKNFIISGISMGATTVLLALQNNLPSSVKGCIADCGFTSPKEIITKVAKDAFHINATYILPILNIFCKIFGKFSIFEDTTENAVKNSKIPILLLHGENDSFVPCEMSVKTKDAAGDICTIFTVPNADHGMSYLVDTLGVNNQIDLFINSLNFNCN